MAHVARIRPSGLTRLFDARKSGSGPARILLLSVGVGSDRVDGAGATVDRMDTPADERGVVAQQEGDEPGDLVRGARTPHRREQCARRGA